MHVMKTDSWRTIGFLSSALCAHNGDIACIADG
jgi:hypothetical protein